MCMYIKVLSTCPTLLYTVGPYTFVQAWFIFTEAILFFERNHVPETNKARKRMQVTRQGVGNAGIIQVVAI